MPQAHLRSAPVPTRQRILNEAERLIAVKGVFRITLQDIAAPSACRFPPSINITRAGTTC